MMRRLTLIAVAAFLAGTATVPLAQAQGKGKGKGKGHKDDGPKVVFVDTDRNAVRAYWVDTYGRGNCPPGLAKKGNGCLPPGQAKKRYVIGQPLPPAIIIERVPIVLVPRLRPVPVGYEYVVLDGDVLLMNAVSRVIADAIVNLFD